MNNFKRRTLIILLSAIVLISIMYLIESSKTQKEKKAQEQKKLIPISEREDIQEIDISRIRGEETLWEVKLAKEGDRWVIKHPFQDIPKDYKVNSILDHLTEDTLSDVFQVGEEELERYGFGKNSTITQVAVKDRDGNTYFFQIGGENSLKHAKYIRRDSQNELGLLEYWKVSYFDISSPRDLRLDRVVDFDILDVDSLEYSSKDKQFTLEKKEDIWWIKSGKTSEIASTRKVRELLSKINNLDVKRWIDNPKEEMKRNPILTIKLSIGEERSSQKKRSGKKGKEEKEKKPRRVVEITIWNPQKGKYYVGTSERKPLLVISEKRIKELLNVSEEDLVSKLVFAKVPFRKLKEVKISWKGNEDTALLGKEGWIWKKAKKKANAFRTWLENVTFDKVVPEEKLTKEEIYTKAEIYKLTFKLKDKKEIHYEIKGLGNDLFVTEEGKVFSGLSDYLPWRGDEEKEKGSERDER